MSDDESPFDEDELASLHEDDPDTLTPEDVFKLVMINRIKGTKVKVELRDKDGDKVELADIITDLLKYMKDKLASENGSQLADNIMPLISNAVVSTLGRMIGIPATGFMLANDTTRTSLIWSMSLAFLLLNYIQKHNLVIHTSEEQISEDEIEEIERKSKANSAAMVGSMLGQDPRSVLEQLVQEGKLKKEDLVDLLGDFPEEEGDDDDGDKKD